MTTMPAGEIVLIHLAVAFVALAVVGSARWWLRRGANHDVPAQPTDVAYLNDGPRLVVFTGLAALRENRSVRVHRGVVAVRGAARAERVPSLQAALLASLRRPRSGADLLRDAKVEAATQAIGRCLARRGWILSARQQTRMLWYGTPGWVVAVWCLIAFVLTLPRFSHPGRPMQALSLLGLGVFLAVGTYVVVDVPPVTRAGQVVLRRVRTELRDTDRDAVPWPLRVAAYGEPELWRLDAHLAERLGAFSGELPPFPRIRRRTFLSRDWWTFTG
jgi:uncharacterized protein (TIGR04222 family)